MIFHTIVIFANALILTVLLQRWTEVLGVFMNFREIRSKNNFSQLEMAILLNVSVANLRAWEAGKMEPEEPVQVKYQQAQNSALVFSLFAEACERKYGSLQEVKLVLSLVPRFSSDKLHQAILEMNLIKSNSHFKPQDLGVTVTKVYVKREKPPE